MIELSASVPGHARIDAGVEVGSYPAPGIEIAIESGAASECITINCSGWQVRNIVRGLLLDYIAKGPIEHGQDILNEAAIELSRARRVIAEREAASCNP